MAEFVKVLYSAASRPPMTGGRLGIRFAVVGLNGHTAHPVRLLFWIFIQPTPCVDAITDVLQRERCLLTE